MPYKMDFNEVLLTGWEAWDTGRYDIPGKNVTLKDGAKGCILLNEEGASVYSRPLDTVNDEDMGECHLTHSELTNGTDNLHYYLSDKDLEEVETVFARYKEYQNSWEA